MFENLFAFSGLSLDRLRAFADIVAAGGITAAAGDDANRQSQFSRQLKELERYFGAELMKRGRGPMELTEAGARLHQIVCHTFGSLEDFRRECARQPVELSIGAGESLIQWLLLPRLPQLMTAHPRLALNFQNLRTDDILKKLADGALDFGVVSRFKVGRIFESSPLGQLDYGLFVPADLMPTKPSLKLLGQVPLAMLRGSDTVRQALDGVAHAHGLKLDIRLRLSSYPQLATAVQCQDAAAVMPTLAASVFPAGSVCVVRLPFLAKLSRRLSLVWSRKVAGIRPSVAGYADVLAKLFTMPPVSTSAASPAAS